MYHKRSGGRSRRQSQRSRQRNRSRQHASIRKSDRGMPNYRTAVRTGGDAYNAFMQQMFGSYRFSDSITEANGGTEPKWLRDLHRDYERSKQSGKKMPTPKRQGNWFTRGGVRQRYTYASDGSRLGVEHSDGGKYGL